MNFELPSWLIAWAQATSVWDMVLWVIGIVLAIIFIRKKGWRWVIAFAKAILSTAQLIESVQGLPAFIARTDSTLAEQNDTLALQDKRIGEIHHETHTNNGSSIKDAVRRTEDVLNTQVLPKLEALASSGAQLRQDFEDTQGGPEIQVTVTPKSRTQEDSP